MATDAPAPGGTRNVPAYEAYLQGKALYNLAKDEATDRQAKADFEIAIAADPDFALAHAALSRSLSSIAAAYAKADELKAHLFAGDRRGEERDRQSPRPSPRAILRLAMRCSPGGSTSGRPAVL